MPSRPRAESVDVVVPSYNHERYVEACLRSIFAQTKPPSFLLVIDDGSTDRSPEIIARVLKDCPFKCEFIARENRGLCATLNEMLDRTASPFFSYLSSDDLWLPNRLQVGLDLLTRNPAALAAYANHNICDENGTLMGNTADRREAHPEDLFQAIKQATYFPHTSTLTVRRSALEGFRWDETATLEDYPLLLHLASRGRIISTSDTLSCWRHHGSNSHHHVSEILQDVLSAQVRFARSSGLNPVALRTWQGSFRFRYALQFLRHGHRLRAAWLTLTNRKYAPSRQAFFQQLLKLARPLASLNFSVEWGPSPKID